MYKNSFNCPKHLDDKLTKISQELLTNKTQIIISAIELYIKQLEKKKEKINKKKH